MKAFLFGFLLLLLSSCTSTKYIEKEVPVEIVKTEYINKIETKYDSIFVRDSIDRYMKGDTVFIEKYRDRYKYRDRVVTDTIVRTDSIEVPVEVKTTEIKEVNKLRWYQSTLMWVGGFSLLILSFILGKRLRTIIR